MKDAHGAMRRNAHARKKETSTGVSLCTREFAVMIQPSYPEKYEEQVQAVHKGDSDDQYEKKDRCTLSDILLDCKVEWAMHSENRKPMQLLCDHLNQIFAFMRNCDADRLMSWKVYHFSGKI